MPPINVNVSGSYTHYAPAERCVVSIRVSKEGKSQSSVVEAVTKLSNDISGLLGSLCPKDPSDQSKGVDATNPAIPITHWSMSSLNTSSWIPYVHVSDKNPDPKQPDRTYCASTNFSVKFKDFQKMGELCLELTKWDEVSVSTFDWRLTDVTQMKLRATVRQGAVKDAIQKATDYVSVFSANPSVTWTGIAKEITDDANSGSGAVYGQPKMMMSMHRSGGGARGESGDALNFEPENVSLSATVSCKFEMVPSTQ